MSRPKELAYTSVDAHQPSQGISTDMHVQRTLASGAMARGTHERSKLIHSTHRQSPSLSQCRQSPSPGSRKVEQSPGSPAASRLNQGVSADTCEAETMDGSPCTCVQATDVPVQQRSKSIAMHQATGNGAFLPVAVLCARSRCSGTGSPVVPAQHPPAVILRP